MSSQSMSSPERVPEKVQQGIEQASRRGEIREAVEGLHEKGFENFAANVAERLDRRDFVKVMGGAVAALGLMGGVGPLAAKAAPASKRFRAVYSSIGMHIFWVNAGAETFKFLGDVLGFDVTVFDGQNSVTTQRRQIEQIAARANEYDVVFIHPSAIGAFEAPVRELIRKGVMVFDIDTKLVDDLSKLDIAAFTEPDNVKNGAAVTEALCRKIGYKGNIVHTQGMLTHTGAQGRAKGFRQVVAKYPDIKVIDETPGDWDPAKVQQIWRDLLSRYDKIDAGFFHNDDMALAAYSVIQAAGRQKEIVLGGIDGMAPALRQMLQGKFYATASNPAARVHGWAMWAAYYHLVRGDKVSKIPNRFIRCDGPTMTLDDPQDVESFIWLNEHFLL